MIANIDNVGASLDPLVLGSHIVGNRPLTLEVVENDGRDVGGGPVRLDGRVVALESFRLPEGFPPEAMPFFSTNTFWITTEALRDLNHDWTYARVTKEVDGRPAVQFERLLNELTLALASRFVLVPRHGAGSRFLPVKDWSELERRREQIVAAIDARSASAIQGRAAG
jgi:UTP--glucose-1-phosphate uridylyltransferase